LKGPLSPSTVNHITDSSGIPRTFATGLLKGARNRIVSSVTYLTPDWNDSDAGHLVLYDGDELEIQRVLPQAGTLVLFMSEDIPHEVLPPTRPRSSIAGWYRCRENMI